MRLLQILALTAFCLIAVKLAVMASAGYFDELTVSAAHAQETAADVASRTTEEPENSEAAQTGTKEEQRPEIGVIRGAEEIENRSSRPIIEDRLSERRQSIAKRERDLELREQLLQAAEQRLRAKLDRLKKLEEEKENQAENDAKNATKDLVVIYENMKPKDAANIFNNLALDIMYMLATSMSPRKMSAILAEMDVKKAERLTVEIASRAARQNEASRKRTLPKIDG